MHVMTQLAQMRGNCCECRARVPGAVNEDVGIRHVDLRCAPSITRRLKAVCERCAGVRECPGRILVEGAANCRRSPARAACIFLVCCR